MGNTSSSNPAHPQGGAGDGVACLDYAHSYMWPYCRPRDAVRVAIESRIILYDDAAGKPTEYFLGASCKSEDTYGVHKDYVEDGFKPGANTLFVDPNYDFTWIVGGGSTVIFRRKLVPEKYRDVRADAPADWGEPRFQLKFTEAAYPIPADQFEPAAQATEAGHALVGQTEIADTDTGRRAVIEYPVKTINVSQRDGYYQVDTGPVLFPDLSIGHDSFVGNFRLAYIAHNCPTWAEFIVNMPTPLTDGIRVDHYSTSVRLDTRNHIIEVIGAD